MTNTELALLHTAAREGYLSLTVADASLARGLAARGYLRRLIIISADVFEFALTATGRSAVRLYPVL